MTFQKSHFSLLQIIEWLINTDTYAHEILAFRFKLPVFNALAEAIVHGCLDYALRVELKM